MAALRYLTLPSNPHALLPQFPSYAFAVRVQTVLQQEFQDWKSRAPSARGPPPPPSILCFTPAPTYTVGRRQAEPLSESEVARLRSPLFVPTARASEKWVANDNTGGPEKTAFFLPTVAHVPRGGLTTYHGPGQLTIWPVIDLHSPLHVRLSVRDYACLLEKTTIATLQRLWGLEAFRTNNPGVWVRSGDALGGGDAGRGERKIAALGVHLRRYVTGLGVAINYSTPCVGPAETNPWARIVPCGLRDCGVTSVREERLNSDSTSQDDDNTVLERLGETWRAEFQKRLKLRDDADSTVPFDFAQTLKDINAQNQDREDIQVEARPIGDLAR